jgi:hypothetical protein
MTVRTPRMGWNSWDCGHAWRRMRPGCFGSRPCDPEARIHMMYVRLAAWIAGRLDVARRAL